MAWCHQETSHYWTIVNPDLCHHMAAPDQATMSLALYVCTLICVWCIVYITRLPIQFQIGGVVQVCTPCNANAGHTAGSAAIVNYPEVNLQWYFLVGLPRSQIWLPLIGDSFKSIPFNYNICILLHISMNFCCWGTNWQLFSTDSCNGWPQAIISTNVGQNVCCHTTLHSLLVPFNRGEIFEIH